MQFAPESPNWSSIRPITITGPASQVDELTIVAPTDVGPMRVTGADDFVRLRLGSADTPDYGLLTGDAGATPIELKTEDSSAFTIRHGDLSFHVESDPLSFRMEFGKATIQQSSSDGHFVRRYRLPPFAKTDDGWLVNLDFPTGESVYGLGEKWGPLNRRGQLVRSINHDALGVNAEISYKNTPVAWSSGGWGLLVHTAGPVVHAVGFPQWSHRAYGLHVTDEVLDLFLFRAPTAASFLGQLRRSLGPAQLPPLWSAGVILSKAYYRDADEVLTTARELRRRNMPCDVITLDGRAWQDTRTRFAFEWCPHRYPDPKPIVDELRSNDLRVCVWEYPLISIENPMFDEWAQKGWLLKHRHTKEAFRYEWDSEPFGEVLTPLPPSGLVDFTHPDAYHAWKEKHRALFELGIDMIKPDFGEQVTDDMVAHNGAAGPMLRNIYSFLYNRCVYEAARAFGQNGAFLFSRSGWLGSHRHPSMWGGDPQADWEGLAASIRGGLSWGLSGGPFYATDVGGFYADTRDPLLYVRWLQASVYSAHIRLHGIGAREPWSYGPEAEQAAMKALRRRYRLIPYLRQTMRASCDLGLPVQRAMCLACPNDRLGWPFDTQFFCGPDLLVAPCLRPDGGVEVYLPAGEWVRFPTGERHAGGRVERLTLSLDEDCVFARAGTRLPLGPAVTHTGSLGDLNDDGTIEEYWTA